MERIGVIGFGSMGSSIGERLSLRYKIIVFDKDESKLKNLVGIEIARDCVDLVNKVSILILAVKPQDFDNLLIEIKDYVKDKLIISIAAGITTAYIEGYLGDVKIIRAMPNLPVKIGEGVICLCKGKSITTRDLVFIKGLFKSLGEVLTVKEEMMNKATVISGCGPAYLYDWAEGRSMKEVKNYAKDTFAPHLTEAARAIGFNLRQAKLLTKKTIRGSIALLEETGLLPEELKRRVASRGGVTEKGLEVLHKGRTLTEAVKTALRRAEDLSR